MFSRNTTKSTSRRAEALERAEPVVQAAHRPVVDVEVQLEARAQQDVGGVLHVGHAGIAEGAHEDGVVVAGQVVEGAGGRRLARLQVVVGAPGEEDRLEGDPPKAADAIQDLDRLGGHVHADSVARDDRDFHEPAEDSTGPELAECARLGSRLRTRMSP